MTSATIKVDVDGTAATEYAWTGSLERDSVEVVTIADIVFPVSGIDTLDVTAYVVIENDGNTTNDSLATEIITKEAFNLPYENIFETDSLEQWISVDGDGDGYNWSVTDVNPYAGTKNIHSGSWDAVNGIDLTPNNWLITPGINVNSEKFFVTYYVGAEDADYFAESYEVLVSGDGTDTTSFTSIYSETLESSEYKKVTIEVDGYKNETVHLAFKHAGSAGQSFLDIDSINVYNVIHDFDLAQVYLEGADGFIMSGETLDVFAIVTNTGNVESTQEVTISANSTTIETFALTLAAGETDTVSTSYITESGTIVITAEITEDENADGNVAEKEIMVYKAGNLLESFEETSNPEYWTIDRWSRGTYNAVDGNCMTCYYQNAKMITRKVRINAGDSLTFYGSAAYATGNVWASSDLVTWDTLYRWSDGAMSKHTIVFSEEETPESLGDRYLAFVATDGWPIMSIDLIYGPMVAPINNEFELSDFTLSASSFLKAGSPVDFEAVVVNNGSDEGATTVYLTVEGDTVANATTAVLATGDSDTISISWTPENSYTNVSINAILSEDDFGGNNSRSVSTLIYPAPQSANVFFDFENNQIPDFWKAGYANYSGWQIQSWFMSPWASAYSGSYALKFGSSYSPMSNTFTSSMLDFSSNLYKVSFYMYRDADAYAINKKDSVNVRVNSLPETANSTLVGTVCRSIVFAPVEESAGWYYYEFMVDASELTEGFIILEGVTTGSGYNMIIDNFAITEYPEYDAALSNLAASGEVLWGSGEGAKGDLTVTLANTGENDLTSATIKVDVDGTAATEYAWTGSLERDSVEVVTIADIVFPVIGIDTLDVTAYVVIENDGNTTNDSLATEIITKEAYELPYVSTFEVDSLAQWVTVDGDGDGYVWEMSDDYSVQSSSWDAVNGIDLIPNNWLITPGISIDASKIFVSYYVAAGDADYFAESYEVLISKEGTDTVSFANIYTETLTSAEAKKVTIEIDGYKNEVVHLAFKHYGSSALSYLDIDSVTVYSMPHAITLVANTEDAGVLTGAGEYFEDSEVTIEAVANVGYRFDNWTLADEVVSTDAVYTFEMGAEDAELTANFIKTYVVTVASNIEGAGTLNFAGDSIVDDGTSLTIAATAAEGFEFVEWISGETVVSTTSEFTFDVSEDTVFTAVFDTLEYTITATAAENGTITPTGDVTVKYDSSFTYTITPNEHFQVADVLVDGVSVGKVTSYTFENVKENHAIEASFEFITSAAETTINELAIYPNPFVNEINVSSAEVIKEIQLIDLNGKVVMSKEVFVNKVSVETNVESGIYMLIVTDVNGAKQLYKVVRK